MTYLDSNVLIRTITGDIPSVATSLLEKISSAKKGEYIIEPVVIAEVCFVLEFHEYNMDRPVIAAALLDFISAPQVVSNQDIVGAIKLYKLNKKLDFTDCWLIILSQKNKGKVISLDKDLNKLLA